MTVSIDSDGPELEVGEPTAGTVTMETREPEPGTGEPTAGMVSVTMGGSSVMPVPTLLPVGVEPDVPPLRPGVYVAVTGVEAPGGVKVNVSTRGADTEPEPVAGIVSVTVEGCSVMPVPTLLPVGVEPEPDAPPLRPGV